MLRLASASTLALAPVQADSRLGERIAIPGAQAIDHVGLVVPDLDQAVAFFTDVLGAATLWRSPPLSGREIDMEGMFDAAGGSTSRLAMLRMGPNINVELVEYTVPGDPRRAPRSSDLGVGHLGFAVEDIDRGGAYLAAHGAKLLQGPRTNDAGPNRGQRSWFFKTPWGLVLELVQRPGRMPYEDDTSARLWEAR